MDLVPLCPHLGEPEGLSPRSRNDHQIDAGRKQIRPLPKAFPADALEPVPDHGASELPRRDDAQPSRGRLGWLFRDEQQEVRGRYLRSVTLKAHEIAPPAEPAVARKARTRHYFL